MARTTAKRLHIRHVVTLEQGTVYDVMVSAWQLVAHAVLFRGAAPEQLSKANGPPGDLAVRRFHDGVDGLNAPLRRQTVQEDGLRPRLLHHCVVDLEVTEHLRSSSAVRSQQISRAQSSVTSVCVRGSCSGKPAVRSM